MDEKCCLFLGIILCLAAVSESGVIVPRALPRDGSSGNGELPLLTNPSEKDKKLDLRDPPTIDDDFNIYENDKRVNHPPGPIDDNDYYGASREDDKMDDNLPGTKPERFPPSADEWPERKPNENDETAGFDDENFDKPFDEEHVYKPIDKDSRLPFDMDRPRHEDGEEPEIINTDIEELANNYPTNLKPKDKWNPGEEEKYKPKDDEKNIDEEEKYKPEADEEKIDEEEKNKPDYDDEKNIDEEEKYKPDDDEKNIDEEEKYKPEDDEKNIDEEEKYKPEADEKNIDEEEKYKPNYDDEKNIDEEEKRKPDDDEKNIDEEEKYKPEDDEEKIDEEEKYKPKNDEEKIDEEEKTEEEEEKHGTEDDEEKTDEQEKEEENHEPKNDDEKKHVPEEEPTGKENEGDEKPEEGGEETDENIHEAEESELSNDASIFDNPFFNIEQVKKYFSTLDKALVHNFRQTLDENSLLNGTLANTTEEEVDIEGKKYLITKSVIKGGDNHSYAYFESLSVKPQMNNSEIMEDFEIKNATHV